MAEDTESVEDLTVRLLQRSELPSIQPRIRELNPTIPETVHPIVLGTVQLAQGR